MNKLYSKTSENFLLIFLLCFFVLLILSGFISPLAAQSAAKLQILLPGMSPAPGTPSGYTGTPFSQTTGVPFQVIVNATDDN